MRGFLSVVFTLGVGLSALWIFDLYGDVSLSYPLVAGAVSVGAAFVGFMLFAFISVIHDREDGAMFNLGNGIWIAPEFVASISQHSELGLDNKTVFEWVSVGMADGRNVYQVDWHDQNIDPRKVGLKTLGYASCEEFCSDLRAAIREAKAR